MSEEEARRAVATFEFPGYRAVPMPVPNTVPVRWCLRVYASPIPGEGDWRHFHSMQAWRRYYYNHELTYTY